MYRRCINHGSMKDIRRDNKVTISDRDVMILGRGKEIDVPCVYL